MLEVFAGTWRLTRVVEDFAAGVTAEFAGTAVLEPDGEGLLYRESGVWGGGPWHGLKAERRSLWRAEDSRIAVFYADGRVFHAFHPVSEGTAEAHHQCDPDSYAVTYRFDLPGAWEADWRVCGPRKDYLSRTRYLRG
jgi:hypothetical protein